MKPSTVVGKELVRSVVGYSEPRHQKWLADQIARVEEEARESMGDRMVPALRNLVIRARMVAEWCDNIAEWTVPPPLNEELRDLGVALTAFDEAGRP